MRKTKCNEKITKVICKAISSGMTIARACSYAGINHQTYYNWRERGEKGDSPYVDFLESLKKAESDCILANLENIKNAAVDGAWQASAWILERRFPKEYGKNQETGNADAAKQIADAIKELSEPDGDDEDE